MEGSLSAGFVPRRLARVEGSMPKASVSSSQGNRTSMFSSEKGAWRRRPAVRSSCADAMDRRQHELGRGMSERRRTSDQPKCPPCSLGMNDLTRSSTGR